VSVPISVVTKEKADNFTRHITAKFQHDDVEKACKRTKLVTACLQLYCKKHRKPSKYLDIRNSCMKDLRRLRAMALAFQSADLGNHKNVELEDILHKSHSKEKHLGDSKLSSNSWTQSSREHQSQRQNLVKTISKLVIAVTGQLTKTSGFVRCSFFL